MCNVTYHSLFPDSAKVKKILVDLIYVNVLCARLTTATTNTVAAAVVVVIVVVVCVYVCCLCMHSYIVKTSHIRTTLFLLSYI